MLNKLIKGILKKKRLIMIIVLGLVFITIILFLIFKLFINNKFYYSESNTANDSKEALNTLYQEYEKSKAVFKVYGDVTEKDNIVMKVTCDGKEDSVTLSDKPVKVANHCIISLTPNGSVYSYLSAYITTPDGSLITVSSFNNSELQLNAYKKETRIVLKNGIVYSRISKQLKSNAFNIQIGNLLLTSSGGEEVVANANILDDKSAFDLLNGGYAVNGSKYYEKIETDTIIGIAGFQTIKGTTKIYQRDDMHIIGGEGHKHYIFFGNSTPYKTIYFTENGANRYAGYYALSSLVEEDLIDEQTTLDENKELDFIGIIDHDDNDQSKIDKIMKKYHDYYANKNNQNNEEENNTDEEENDETNNQDACEIYTELSGYNPTGICWCRNDFHLSDAGLNEINSKGYNYSKSDFIYCYTFTTDSYVEGHMLKECAESLGWPGTYSNQGGYSCD